MTKKQSKKKFLLTMENETFEIVKDIAEKQDRSVNKTLNILIELGIIHKKKDNERID